MHSTRQRAAYRLKAFAISLSLSKRGIAPRWQGWATWADSANNLSYWQRKLDASYYDLAWLSESLADHVPRRTRRWRRLFNEPLDRIENWTGFAAWDVTQRKKLLTLDLPRGYELGLRLYVSKHSKLRIQAADLSARRFEARQILSAGTTPQLTPKLIESRVVRWRALYLAGHRKPGLAAQIYTHMTGIPISKQAMSESAKKFSRSPKKRPVGRKRASSSLVK